MRTPGTAQELERQRFRAVALLDVGHRPGAVAQMLNVSPAAVSQGKTLYPRAGPEGLKAIPHRGPKPKLTPPQRQKLARLLVKGPQAHGYPTDLWTLKRMAEVIERHFGVHYDPSGVWHVLKALGWSCQKPERRARECDEEAIAAWRQEEWPRIKKGESQRS
jgi:transposase